MSTRSITHVKDNGNTLVTIYRQCDGYPSGLGAELANFLFGTEVVNGLRYGQSKAFNGAGCLAASLVAHLKNGPGGVYIYPPGSTGCGEEYEYTVHVLGIGGNGEPILIECNDGESSFKAKPERFLAWTQEQDA